jgi:UDP-N-acetylmuramoylalanine--D-glutamate ligase
LNFKDKKIGIWGFGVVGRSVYKFVKQFTDKIDIYDEKEISELGANKNFNLNNFLRDNEIIIPSPGIDIRDYKEFKDKFLYEVDIFYTFFPKKIIALTGTVGKTSTINLIHQLFKSNKVGLGGNVGFPMLDLINTDIDIALLEVSSFQLENAKIFAPDLVVWTNFYQNHLDRHSSLNEYFLAKFNIIKYQTERQKALSPLNLIEKIRELKPRSKQFFFTNNIDDIKLNILQKDEHLFFIEDGLLKLMSHNSVDNLFNIEYFPEISFIENWIIIYAVFYLQNIFLQRNDFKFNFKVPEHRLENFAQYKGAIFYNDSKSTVSESTLSAIKRLNSKDLILIIGGLSKGADRSNLIKACVGAVKRIYIFGKESGFLKKLCDSYNLDSYKFDTLNQVVENLFMNLSDSDQVLFSPAGSSYDLFKNYEERGAIFKELVLKNINKN